MSTQIDLRSPVVAEVPRYVAFDRLSLAVATMGVGFIPVVPATWASGFTTLFYWLTLTGVTRLYSSGSLSAASSQSIEVIRQTSLLLILVPLGLIGIAVASRAEQLLKRKDPKPVVIDEVVGQLITFLFVPITAGPGLMIVGFLAFRFFDIVKPYPIRRLEGLKGGLGIMADDVAAGAYGAVLMALLQLAQIFK